MPTISECEKFRDDPYRGFGFIPGSWVVVTFCGINYRGRIEECRWKQGKDAYWVAYVDDRAEIKTNEFSHDELAPYNA